ncbi:lipopolysaccharide transport periplasmic protein LptA [Acinetobacter apis]|uniref:Lipopolysaccharide export system protein LptA n=1 Tax=Acinetobacter apis TaxID=1229165 RepID=A0A217EE22_9GAMM|nr:lipopolysaccharide transport periplasmic protein LptA [Acinetobacter apis]SNQ28769.1 lipopolysaccharide export system protein LptA [Acinetobacter apis]
MLLHLKRVRHHVLLKLAIGSLTVMTATAHALPSDRSKPISLNADKATYNDKTGFTTYTGNVVIEQGTMKLQASAVTAQLNKDRQISTVTATGNPAQFQQQTEANKGLAKGQGQRIVYNADTGIIVLTGNAMVTQDGASVRGGSLRYSMNKGDIEAVGSNTSGGSSNKNTTNSGRVQIIIPPNSSKISQGAVSP